MKQVFKSAEPPCLQAYRSSKPSDGWDQMKNNSQYFGQAVYDCIAELVSADQGGLCAYCEIEISRSPLNTFRVDHFVAKSLSSSRHNWGLDWENMLACCKGGENQYTRGRNHFEKPRSKNLSCDAHVNRLAQKDGTGMPLDDRRGLVINPLSLPTSPLLIRFDTDQGALEPHPQRCAEISLEGNKHASTYELVENTIRVFNLNCPRLCRARKDWFDELEDKLEATRQAGRSAAEISSELCEVLLSPPYPSFFTVSRLWLGPIAEEFLQRNQLSSISEP
jgi:uncharacterized protein (TIGR02646 family)